MPELPEVQTVRSDLLKYIKNKIVKKVLVKDDFVKKISPAKKEFIAILTGAKVKNIDRRGKLLIFDFGKNKKLLAHLKMTGQFIYSGAHGKLIYGGHPIEQSCKSPDRFNKVLFDFGSGGKLYFNDIRKFGFMKIVDDEALVKEKQKYGVEPIDEDFTFEKFNEILNKKKNLEIKKVLLMQDLIAGIGNIYADEACFAAGIRPSRRIKTITRKEREKLFLAIRRIIKKAIKYRGTSINTFIDCDGQKGSYVKFLQVYGRVGKLCKKCQDSVIKKTKVAGRGTSFCPVCQK